MKLLRTIAWSGWICLLALTPACKRDEQKPDEPVPIVLGGPKERPPDPRIKKVQPAVDKGVAFLRKQVPLIEKMPVPYSTGYSLNMRPAIAGLIGLALLEGGLEHDDPDILKIAATIRRGAPTMNATYDLAASLFFLNRWNEMKELSDKDRAMARTLSLRIIAGQVTSGIWGYGGVIMAPGAEAKLLASLKDGTYKPSGAQTVSMSNTQFAMLAVWGSHKHGVPVREPLLALAGYFHNNQLDNGRWVYPGHSLAATSTCAGLISLAIERVLLEDKQFAVGRPAPERKKKADVNKAFEFVGKTVGRKLTDQGGAVGYGGKLFNADAGGDLYFLWTLERVGVIYSKDIIGKENWYDWGYPILLKEQKKDGSWDEGAPGLGGGPLIDTCFAILFLKRSNIAKDLTDKLRLLSFLRQRPMPLLPHSGPCPA